jgi:hypothetical protein
VGAWTDDGPIVCGGIIQNPYKYADECFFISSPDNQTQWSRGPTMTSGRNRGRGLADNKVQQTVLIQLLPFAEYLIAYLKDNQTKQKYLKKIPRRLRSII